MNQINIPARRVTGPGQLEKGDYVLVFNKTEKSVVKVTDVNEFGFFSGLSFWEYCELEKGRSTVNAAYILNLSELEV